MAPGPGWTRPSRVHGWPRARVDGAASGARGGLVCTVTRVDRGPCLPCSGLRPIPRPQGGHGGRGPVPGISIPAGIWSPKVTVRSPGPPGRGPGLVPQEQMRCPGDHPPCAPGCGCDVRRVTGPSSAAPPARLPVPCKAGPGPGAAPVVCLLGTLGGLGPSPPCVRGQDPEGTPSAGGPAGLAGAGSGPGGPALGRACLPSPCPLAPCPPWLAPGPRGSCL